MSIKGSVGVFDSGLGGLTVVREIKKKCPGQKIIYLGDTARVPYGTRSPETIVKFSLECAGFLQKQGVERIVIACNTASAYASEEIKAAAGMPVFEMISWGAKGAAGGKKIGVIGTRATIKSGAYDREIKKINSGAEITSVATPLLVPLIEEGEIEGKLIEEVCKKYIDNFSDADTLVLGCTHYPVIVPVIEKLLPGVRLVNPGEELAKEWEDKGERGEDKYYFTDLPGRYIETAEMFLGERLAGKVERVII